MERGQRRPPSVRSGAKPSSRPPPTSWKSCSAPGTSFSRWLPSGRKESPRGRRRRSPRRPRDDDLAAVRGRADPRRDDDVHAHVALLAEVRLAGVDADAQAHDPVRRPRLASRARCSAAAARTASVALGKARKTPSPAQSTSRPPRRGRTRARAPAAVPVRARSRPRAASARASSSLDVGEEQRDRAAGSCLLGSSRTGMSERVYEARSVPPSGGADRIRGRSCGVCLRSRAGELAGGVMVTLYAVMCGFLNTIVVR